MLGCYIVIFRIRKRKIRPSAADIGCFDPRRDGDPPPRRRRRRPDHQPRRRRRRRRSPGCGASRASRSGTLLRVAQAAVVLQVLLGAILLLLGHEAPDDLHYLYGVLPLLVSLLAEAARAGAAERELEGLDFDVAAEGPPAPLRARDRPPRDRDHGRLGAGRLRARAARRGHERRPVLSPARASRTKVPLTTATSVPMLRVTRNRWPTARHQQAQTQSRTAGRRRRRRTRPRSRRRELIAWCQAHQLPVPAERSSVQRPVGARVEDQRVAAVPAGVEHLADRDLVVAARVQLAQRAGDPGDAPSRIGTPSRSLQPTSRNFSVCGALVAKPRASASWPPASTLTPKRAGGADDVERPRAAVEAGEHQRRIERERGDRVRRRPRRALRVRRP